MRIEIKEKLNLKYDENWRINLHSFYNLIQVLFTELNILKQILGKSPNLDRAIEQVELLHNALKNPEETIASLKNLQNFKSIVFSEVDKAVLSSNSLNEVSLNHLEESLLSLDKIVVIVEARTEDFLRVISHKDEWITFDTLALTNKLKDVLLTMGIRSKGRYGITFDKETRSKTNYYFDINMAEGNEAISLPALFPDIIRDITSNAKKYSPIGSDISCILSKSADKITLTVRDNGRGIPEEDLPNIVKYGYRASNVTEEETLGDGFGLTKAYLITSENNGRMYIDSVLGEYTEVTIEIPTPN